MKRRKNKKAEVLAIFNAWEKKSERWWFDLGQKYPDASLVSSFDFGWIVFRPSDPTVFDSKEYDKALIKFLEKNPQYNEGQDFSPDDDDDGTFHGY